MRREGVLRLLVNGELKRRMCLAHRTSGSEEIGKEFE